MRIANIKNETFNPKDPLHVYVGRNPKWIPPWQHNLGNPFSHMSGTLATHRVATREEAIEKYKEYLMNRIDHEPELWNFLYTLNQDTVLFCHCSPLPCHAEVIARVSEELRRHKPF
jgi:hypothetical protein